MNDPSQTSAGNQGAFGPTTHLAGSSTRRHNRRRSAAEVALVCLWPARAAITRYVTQELGANFRHAASHAHRR
jgi:hypothetical protein